MTAFLLLLNSAPKGLNRLFYTFLIYHFLLAIFHPNGRIRSSFLFKTGNYGGVAILSCFAKFFEVTVYDYIFLSVKSSIISAQHGFFKGRSTVINSIEFNTYVLNCMENSVQVDAIYTDFFKAFDKDIHRLLLRKLAKLGFGGSFFAWIRSYLTGREQFVKAIGSQSKRLSVRAGVPQGSPLGHLLFILKSVKNAPELVRLLPTLLV
jgi:hypothetical protein